MDRLIELNQARIVGGSQSGGFLPTGKRTALNARQRVRTKVRRGEGARGAAAAHRNFRTSGPGTSSRMPAAVKSDRAQPRYLTKAASKAVIPINPAAQKFHRFILCSAFDNSVTLSGSSMPCLMWGKRHMADRNQNAAEPHAVIITPVSMNDLIVIP